MPMRRQTMFGGQSSHPLSQGRRNSVAGCASMNELNAHDCRRCPWSPSFEDEEPRQSADRQGNCIGEPSSAAVHVAAQHVISEELEWQFDYNAQREQSPHFFSLAFLQLAVEDALCDD